MYHRHLNGVVPVSIYTISLKFAWDVKTNSGLDVSRVLHEGVVDFINFWSNPPDSSPSILRIE